MKNLILLKAISSKQAQRNYLKVYVGIKVIGTWKTSDMEKLNFYEMLIRKK